MVKHLLRVAPAILISVWSVVYGGYWTLGAWLTLGPTDFNGNPNSVSTNIVGLTLLATVWVQIAASILLVKRSSWRLRLLLIVAATAPLLTGLLSDEWRATSLYGGNLLVILVLVAIESFIADQQESFANK
ncbi:hypothetical protein CYG49_00295 [Candidatus Saccharibacteria bacterium]|nr:MAG: hypothetical protein CYG49_00295 [Candidatus Saccharibacteria bacterium]